LIQKCELFRCASRNVIAGIEQFALQSLLFSRENAAKLV